MASPCKTMAWALVSLLLFPMFALAELPNADDRPFWTQKTCYREGGTVFAVGLSMGKRSLEDARKASFKAALWEISNYAQISDTTLFLVETQMTYEEQNPDASYSVWRLVRIPFPMIEKARELLTGNTPATRSTVHRIKELEREDREDLADELRRALLQGEEEPKRPSRRAVVDKSLPTGSVHGINPTYHADEMVTLTIRAVDDTRLGTLLFFIHGTGVRKTWGINGQKVTKKISFPASSLGPGKQVYTIKITDAAGNASLKKGVFRIVDFHDELYDILSRDMD